MFIQATKKKCYWAKYIRNQKSVWIGEETESLILKKFIFSKLNILKTPWTIISNIPEIIEYPNNSNIKNKYFCTPEAQDIIPFVLLKIKEKNLLSDLNNNINYLYNFF